MPSIKDVAKRAGVSVASVSRVLNNRGYISETLRSKVYLAIQEIDYHPNEFARNFQKRRTKLIGLIIPDVHHIFFSTMTLHIENKLRENDYKLLLCNAMNSKNLELSYIDMLRNNQVDGIIIGSHTLEIEKYLNLKLPIVAFDRYLGDEIPVISSDHYEGGLLAARELMIAGCSNIIQVSAYKGSHLVCNERHLALEQYCADRNINCSSYELPLNVFNFENYCEVAGELLDSYKPDGVFAEDIVAAAFIKEAHRRNISIPADLKIVGYDGTTVADMVTPTLTSISQPIEAISSKLVETLIDIINGAEKIPKRISLPTTLIRGESCS